MQIIEFQTRPIDKWPREYTVNRLRGPFKVGYGTMNRDLYRELELLGSKAVVVLMAIEEQDIRMDGRPKASAKLKHPGVIVAAETKHGPMRWACDTYLDFPSNMRAISLTLKGLRLIDGYGCTAKGEQYRGWQAIQTGDDSGFPTAEDARKFMRTLLTIPSTDSISDTNLILRAVMKAHPDHNSGSDVMMKQVLKARAKIEGAL